MDGLPMRLQPIETASRSEINITFIQIKNSHAILWEKVGINSPPLPFLFFLSLLSHFCSFYPHYSCSCINDRLRPSTMWRIILHQLWKMEMLSTVWFSSHSLSASVHSGNMSQSSEQDEYSTVNISLGTKSIKHVTTTTQKHLCWETATEKGFPVPCYVLPLVVFN